MDRFNEMRALVSVVEAKSFAGASEKIGVSRAGVTRLIGDLEQRLGVRMLNRTTRNLSLTPEGEIFYARCRRLVLDTFDAEAEMAEHNNKPTGDLRISAPVSFGVRYLAPMWPRFFEKYPQVCLDIHLTDQVVDLIDHHIDLAIRIGKLGDSSLVSRQISSTTMRLCASPTYLEKFAPISEPKELAEHAVIAYSYWSEQDEWEFTHDGEVQVVKTRPVMRVNNGETCLAAALAGVGLVLAPDFMCADLLRAGLLEVVLPEHSSKTIGIHLVYPSRKYAAPKLRAMMEFLNTEFNTLAW
ncbi:MAG: hypothetical protein RLZZ502_1532 [Pseudomonadota bacterium]